MLFLDGDGRGGSFPHSRPTGNVETGQRTDRLLGLRQPIQSTTQSGMHGNAPNPTLAGLTSAGLRKPARGKRWPPME
jgi:hypothetical protein